MRIKDLLERKITRSKDERKTCYTRHTIDPCMLNQSESSNGYERHIVERSMSELGNIYAEEYATVTIFFVYQDRQGNLFYEEEEEEREIPGATLLRKEYTFKL